MTEHFLKPTITAHQQTYGIALAEDLIRLAHTNGIITFAQLRKMRALLNETYPTPTHDEMDVERVVLDIINGDVK